MIQNNTTRADKDSVALKLRDCAARLDDLVRWYTLDYGPEMEICNAASGIRWAAAQLETDDALMVRCRQCGVMMQETTKCKGCNE